MSPAQKAAPPIAIKALSERGHGLRGIARLLGISRNAVRRALRSRTAPAPSGVEGPAVAAATSGRRASKLDVHRDAIAELLHDHPRLTAVRILEEIRKKSFDGSISTVKRLVRTLRPGPVLEAYDRIETAPGLVSQADWSPYKVTIAGAIETVHALSVTLCYSRMLFVAFYRREDQASLLAGLIHAFRYFGAVPMTIVFDNPSSIVAARLGPVVRFQERLLALSRHYGFTPRAARVRRPRDKAKVERPFQDIEANFVYARGPFASLEQMNEETRTRLHAWNGRIHGTTHERPWERLEVERQALLPLPAKDFDTRIAIPVGVSEDFTIPFDGSRYSVPPRLVGERGFARGDEAWVEFVHEGIVVARHARTAKKGAREVLEEHRAEFRALRRESRRESLEERAGGAPDPDGYEASVRDFMLTFGDVGEKYLAALVATFRGGARHELRRTLEVRDRVGEDAFRRALERAASYGAAGGATIERIAEDLIRRGLVARRASEASAPLDRSPSPEVPVRPLSYYHEILAAEAEATPRSRAEPDTPGGRA